jgi:integrase/recombinase XerD
MTTTEEILASWRLWQQSQSLSDRTITERAATVRQLLEYSACNPLELTPDAIIAFTARQEISPASRGTYHASIRAYCAWLVKTGRRDDNPSVLTPTPKRPRGVPRPVPSNNLALVLSAANRRRTRMMLLLAAMAGLRVHEVAKFRGEDIDLVNGVITVTGKGGVTAMIPAHEAIVAAAGDFPRAGWWFPTYTENVSGRQHISAAAVSSAILSTMRRAGVTGKPHQLRHWYGTTLLDQGVDVRVVRDLMRHRTIATTELYTLVSWPQLRAAMGSLPLPRAA